LLYSTDPYGSAKSLFRDIRECPLAWFAIGLGVAWIGVFLSKCLPAIRRYAWLRSTAFAAGMFVVCAYVAITLDSLRSFMIPQDEANILSISAATLHGLPMYHLPASPDYSYSLMYGPFTFLISCVALVAGGVNHFWIVRVTAVLASLGACAALLLLLRRFVTSVTAVALLAFPLSILLQHTEVSLSIHADIWIFLFSTLAVLSSLLEAELLAIILTGICGGVLVGLKITAAPAILFPLWMLYRRFGIRPVFYSLLAVIAVSFAPFAVPNISLHNYIAWILFTRTEGISLSSAMSNALFAVFLISPALLMELYMRHFGSAFRRRVPEFLIILLCLFVAVLTSKNGSGLHYLWHVVPSIVAYMAFIARDMSQVPDERRVLPVYYIALGCLLFTCVNIRRAYEYIELPIMPANVAAAQQSIRRYLNIYRGRSSVQMGYGSDDGDYRTLLRYELVYKGQPYWIEGNTGRFETRMLPFPANVFGQMEHCKDDVWLIPHGQEPFELGIFPDRLRKTFVRNYSIDRTDGIFDAWTCDVAKPAPPL
jgi:hypothetical protein